MSPAEFVEIFEACAVRSQVLVVERKELIEVDLLVAIFIGNVPEMLQASGRQSNVAWYLRATTDQLFKLCGVNRAISIDIELREDLLVCLNVAVMH